MRDTKNGGCGEKNGIYRENVRQCNILLPILPPGGYDILRSRSVDVASENITNNTQEQGQERQQQQQR